MLRPFREGAVWTYRGQQLRAAIPQPINYTTRTTHGAVVGGTVTESFSNPRGEGANSQSVSISGGVVSSVESIDFAGKGVFESIQFVELRSPVRQNDQFTIVDRRYTDTNIDVDDDEKPDTLDVGVYGRVVGVETLTLEGLPPITAVRVDVIARARLTISSDGQQSEIVESTVQTWYARGIGIVRQRSSDPTDSGDGVDVDDERLASWDGITQGFGALPVQSAALPVGGDPNFPPALTMPATATLGDQGLVLVSVANGQDSTAVRVDSRGNVVSTRPLPNLAAGSEGLTVPHAAGMVYLRFRPGPNSQPSSIVELTRIDSSGAVLGTAGGITIDLAGPRTEPLFFESLRAAVDGTTLWLLWSRIYSTPFAQERELILRPYTLEGTSLGPELVVEPRPTLDQQIAAVGGRVLLSWVSIVGGNDLMYASVRLGDTSVSRRTLVPSLPSGAVGGAQSVFPTRAGPQGALIITAPIPDIPPDATAGLLLDPTFGILRAGLTLAGDLLSGVPRIRNTVLGVGAAADGSRLVFSFDDRVHWLTPVAGRFLTVEPVHRVVIGEFQAQGQLVFPDRVVLVRTDRGRLETMLVWLNSGTAP